MKILVTGAGGFIGQNLVAMLKAVRDRKVPNCSALAVEEIFAVGRETPDAEFLRAAEKADFVFHLAGVNRPENGLRSFAENVTVTEKLVTALETCGNTCPVMFASSVQASLSGRFCNSEYGKTKAAAENVIFSHGVKTGAKCLVYRFPNIFGKWCRPFYNSAVATFCHQIANGLPLTVHDRSAELELLYIDDVVEELLGALSDREHRCNYQGETPVFCADGVFCASPESRRVTLGTVADLLTRFAEQPRTLVIPNVLGDRFAKNLYSTYLSYLPAEKVCVPLVMHEDSRGSFTELLRSPDCGQVSVNVQKPGIVKGEHWHSSKWEQYVVVSGHALIEQRKIGTDEVLRFEVSSDRLKTVYILPGYTHNIKNLSETEDLVTVMWVNEPFDPATPDTVSEQVRICQHRK